MGFRTEKNKVIYIHPDTKKVTSVVHMVGPHQDDMSLCGADLAGDEWFGYDPGEVVSDEQINCKDCVLVIEACKSVDRHDYTIAKSKVKDSHLAV